ncbi:D-alanine--D-alanine ligase [Mesorhizobium sp. M1342]|uniref:D-alanine--D-alanine ligase n=1 Tax=Mesorhizobium sp. M1342 TaxID=2957088 RepID=UPI00333AE980
MTLDVSFMFGGYSTEYDSSISSLKNCISSFISIPLNHRPFCIRHLYHISRQDGLVRTVQFHDGFTSSDLQDCILNLDHLPGSKLINAIEDIEKRKEYVVNLLHGQFGEDGGAQTIAALSGLKGTFGDPQVASLTMNKYAMSSFVSSLLPAGIVRVPATRLINSRNLDDAIRIARSFRGPVVVKPNSLGLSLFTALFPNPAAREAEITELVLNVLRYDTAVLFQEFIFGDEYSCGCIMELFEVTPLPVVKIETENHFFGPAEKSNANLAVKRLIDGNGTISNRIKNITRQIANSMNLCNISRFDFVVAPNDDVFFLECNYIPGLAKGSILDMAIQSHGMTVIELIARIASHSRPFERKAIK